MKLLNFGSLNIDHVYRVEHIVTPGETISSNSKHIYPGGKGLNQSIAVSKSGIPTYHAGCIGNDGRFILDALEKESVNTEFISLKDSPSGHAVIQVDTFGQNSIIVYPGTNNEISKEHIDYVLKNFNERDIILLQNEINNLKYIINEAYKKGIQIILNPSPFSKTIDTLPLEKVSYLAINEVEGKSICNATDIDNIIPSLHRKYPNLKILLTLGDKGCLYYDGKKTYKQEAIKTNVIDTTAAGDTFLGFFIYGIITEKTVDETLKIATVASSITISRNGASTSIPTIDEVKSFELNQP